MSFSYYKRYDSDCAGDVRSQYVDALRCGKDGSEATKQLMADFAPALADEEDAFVFWTALAEIQWDWGRLEESTKYRALICIANELEAAGRQTGNSAAVQALISDLIALRQKLSSPQPPEKPVKAYRLYHTDWKAGDVFAYRLSAEEPDFCGKYVHFAVKGTETWYPGHTIPIVYVYAGLSSEPLPPMQLAAQKYWPQFYTPEAYKNHPELKPLYALGLLCTSARVIPKQKLTYLGNIGGIAAIKNEDPGFYPIAWKKFDSYIIKNALTWSKSIPSSENPFLCIS